MRLLPPTRHPAPTQRRARQRRRRFRSLRQPIRYAALVAGGIPVLAFPAANLEFLAWIALVPGLAVMRSSPTKREAAVRGCWFGAGYILAAMYWLTPNIGPALLLVAIVFGLLWSAVGVAVWSTLRPPVTARRALAALVVVPSAWLVTEWIRSWQGIGGPWAVFGASQWQHPVMLALGAVGGIWLISFALVAANTGILLAIVARPAVLRAVGAVGAAIAILAGPVAYALTKPPATARQVTVALVQPGLTGSIASRLLRNEQLTDSRARGADLVVWGESSVGYNLAGSPLVMASLERLSGEVRSEVLVDQDARNSAGAVSKQATLISSTGIRGNYVKTRLVPFGEYIPFRSALGWLTKISRAAPQNILPGTGAHVMQATLPGGRRLTVGVLICFESAFPDMSRVDANHGAQMIIYQTSDSTFQASWAPAQHASLSAVRAAETGRPVVQAALTGDSAAFDARGRELAWAGTSYRGVLLVHLNLPSGSYRTIFDRYGDYVPWTAVGIAGLAALLGVARIVRDRRKQPGDAGAAPTGTLADSQLSS